MRRLTTTLLLAAALIGGGATASAASISSSQLLSLEGQFFCVSCHEPLNQVYSAEAQAEKGTLAQLVDAGLSMSAIKSQMVADYGEGVLAKPSDPWIYVVPIVAVITAFSLLFWVLPRWRRRRGPGPRPTTPVAVPLSDADQARLDAELEAF